jgi:hypothetical protein
MNTRLTSEKALTVIDQYLHFRYDGATTNVPYYNNSRKAVRAGLRGALGKGSPRDIFDETDIAMAREKISKSGGNAGMMPSRGAIQGAIAGGSFIPDKLSDSALKHFLVDHTIGIDCSGFVYYVMNAEFSAQNKGSIDRHLAFPYVKGIFGKLRAKMRPAENADVATFAHAKNSRVIALNETKPGDIIVMVDDNQDVGEKNKQKKIIDRNNRDHILFIHQVDYQNFVPIAIYYSHSVAWPSDGTYDHGVRQGKIEILDIKKPLTEQKWIEAEKIGEGGVTKTDPSMTAVSENYTFTHALKARTEIRRMLSL